MVNLFDNILVVIQQSSPLRHSFSTKIWLYLGNIKLLTEALSKMFNSIYITINIYCCYLIRTKILRTKLLLFPTLRLGPYIFEHQICHLILCSWLVN